MEDSSGSRRKLIARHKNEVRVSDEQRAYTSQNLDTQLKQKLAKCRDKASKRDIMDQHKNLMEALLRKHELELQSLSKEDSPTLYNEASSSDTSDAGAIAAGIIAQSTGQSDPKENGPGAASQDRLGTPRCNTELQESLRVHFYEDRGHLTKSQRRKQKKREATDQTEASLREAHDKSGVSEGTSERIAILERLTPLGLTIYDIPSDGHCLFRAIEHQLRLLDSSNGLTFGDLRKHAAKYLLDNKDCLESFFRGYQEDDVSQMHKQTYDEHCESIANTAAWGGELELTALSHFLNKPIKVYQKSPPYVICYNSSTPDDNTHCPSGIVRLSYHRFAYVAGAHYNSVVPVNGFE